MSSDLHPTEGARFLLELDRALDTRAVYRVSIYTRDAVFATTATLGEDGSVALDDPLVAAATAEHVDQLVMFARLTARGAAKRRTDGRPAWPPRVLRWR